MKRDGINQWIEFLLGDSRCAVPILSAQEILKTPDIARLPGMPPYLRGIIHLRGRILPVVDLAARFGGQAVPGTGRDRIIVAHVAGQKIGFLVQEVTKILRLEDDQIGDIPEHLSAGGTAIQAVGRTADGLVLLWNLERILSMEELALLQKLPAK